MQIEYQIFLPLKLQFTMDGSRISGGTFGAVNGSALTSLPSSPPSSFSVVGAYAFAYGDTNKHQGHTSGGGNLSFASGGGSGQSFLKMVLVALGDLRI